ncbi:MAG: hypothetical protein FJY95_01675 [Candidatus Handelsmanbacteria bacterium]|nr:hypothetical protein [Candidatus Handelsmanbacteria bacterium]
MPWRRSEALLLALAALAGAGLFLWQEHRLAGRWGFPLDDAWIHLQFARNLAAGQGFSFNPGEVVSASTAPLWTLLLAPLFWLPWEVVWSAKVLGVGLLWLAGLLTLRLGLSLGLERGWALAGGLVVVLTPRLVWGSLSGMEVLLYAALGLYGCCRHLETLERAACYRGTAALALAALARPECLLLFPLVLLDRRRLGHPLPWKHLLLYAGLLAPFVTFNLYTLGKPLPNTFYAKVGPYGLTGALAAGDWVRVAKVALYYPLLQAQELAFFCAENNLVLACLAPLGFLYLLRQRRGSWWVLLAVLSFPLFKGLLAPFKGALFQHGRYAAHLIPLVVLVGLLGLRWAWQLLAEGRDFARWRRLRRWAGPAVWGAVFLHLLVNLPAYALTYGWNVTNIEDMHVRMGRWLAGHTPPGALIASHDVGAIAFFSGRRVLDTTGLVTPRALAYLPAGGPADGGVRRLLEAEKPALLVMLPNWYPHLAQERGFLHPVYEIQIEHNTICAGDKMAVYELRQ